MRAGEIGEIEVEQRGYWGILERLGIVIVITRVCFGIKRKRV